MTLPARYLDEFSEPPGYVEFASTGPVSASVRRAVAGLFEDLGSPHGSISTAVFPRYEAALGVIAGFMDVPVGRIAPLAATSAGLFQAAFGLLGAGGNVVLPAHEFPANVYPWLRAEAAGGPAVRMVAVPDGRVTPEAIAGAVDRDTRAVAVSLVDFQTGFRIDLDGMREAAGRALLVVDAIQGLGAVHSGIGAADVMVAGGQKWMRAGWGSGVMAVSGRALERLAPTLSGWLGVEDAMETGRPAPHPVLDDAGRFQEGTPPIVGAFQMAAAIEVIGLAGIGAIRGAVLDAARSLEEVVRRAGGELHAPWRSDAERAGIVSFRLPGAEPAATHEHLISCGVFSSLRGDWVRLSPHATTGGDATAMLGSALGVGD